MKRMQSNIQLRISMFLLRGLSPFYTKWTIIARTLASIIFWLKPLASSWRCRFHLIWHQRKTVWMLGIRRQSTHCYKFLFVQTSNVNKTLVHFSEIVADGKFANLLADGQMAASIPYYQDKLIWCIQHAQKYPIFINFFFIIPSEMWIFILTVGFTGVSILIYFLIPFDENYGYRIKHYDMFYCFLWIVIPAVTAASCTFNPKKFRLRTVYWLLLVCPMLFHIMIGIFLFNFMNYQFYLYQISTVDEILDANFRLTGSIEVLNAIKQDAKVIPREMRMQYGNSNLIIVCFTVPNEIDRKFLCMP